MLTLSSREWAVCTTHRHERDHVWRRIAVVISLVMGMLVVGCSATLKPKITVIVEPTRLEVSGTGFSNTSSSCASLAVIGMPSGPSVFHMGDPTCVNGANGAFFKFIWDLKYIAGCTANTPQSVAILALDNPTLDPAAATVSIPWGSRCAFAGSCGMIGQQPCPTGCLQGAVSATSDLCSCGAEGQPLCPTGNACQAGLNPQLEGAGNLVCEASCGYPPGYYCTAAMVAAGVCSGSPPQIGTLLMPCVTEQDGQSVYTCYGNSQVGGLPGCSNLTCQPGNKCQQSVTTGPLCTTAVAKKCQ